MQFPALETRSEKCISETKPEIILKCFQDAGWLIVEDLDSSEPAHFLDRLGTLFGKPIFHNMSGQNGVYPIQYIPGSPEYANTTTEDLPLHTDGSFEEISPRVVLVYCEIKDSFGGKTRIAQARKVYEYLCDFFPKTIPGLFRSDAIAIKRGDRFACKPIFRMEDERILMIFRSGSDIPIRVHPEAQEGFKAIQNYLLKSGNFLEFILGSRQVLIMDNTRILHGRTSFSQNSHRKLHCLWCDGNSHTLSEIEFGFPKSGLISNKTSQFKRLPHFF